jgi:Type II secretion system (T2SS), protein M subtype b
MSRRRVLALSLLVGAVLLLGLVIIQPVTNLVLENRAAIRVLEERLSDLQSRRLSPAAIDRRRAVDAVSDTQAGLLGGGDAEIQGRLEAHVRASVQRRGGEVLSIRPGPAGEEEGVRIIRANVSLRLSDDRLLDMVASLETGAPVLFFETVKLRRLDGAPGAGADRVEVNGTVRAYLERHAAAEKRS